MKKAIIIVGIIGVALGVFLLFLKLIPLLIVVGVVFAGILLFLSHLESR